MLRTRTNRQPAPPPLPIPVEPAPAPFQMTSEQYEQLFQEVRGLRQDVIAYRTQSQQDFLEFRSQYQQDMLDLRSLLQAVLDAHQRPPRVSLWSLDDRVPIGSQEQEGKFSALFCLGEGSRNRISSQHFSAPLVTENKIASQSTFDWLFSTKHGTLKITIDPTDGFTNIPLTESNFKLQKPYDIPLEQRYSFQNGVHRLWVYADDKPYDPSSPAQPRTEIRILGLDYSYGVWQFEGYGFVPNSTFGATIVQIHGATNYTTTIILRIYNWDMRYYSVDLVDTDLYDKWFRVNLIHDVDKRNLTVFIDGVKKFETKDRGAALLLCHIIFALPTLFDYAAFASSLTGKQATEATALLTWKASLHNQTQILMSSWVGTNHCTWLGIGCNKAGRVAHIDLHGYDLKGNLGNLTTLYLYDNQLSGSIPQEIGMLRSLVHLELERNNLTDSIPQEIGMLRSLVDLDFSRNKLTCSIPASIHYYKNS
ncbi:hypothetical protein TEA_007864 [Camellia sinensis var. sinensis]|uniref:Uncharacterized protein n=1 Tax=Camellia sinensis var. sinensis TaxID=542762 RepID=A0A4S4E4G0_CAMSN|nr:hypothetical protein TEA_007864 [Camellia sinensis var. sinensis]